MKRVTCDTNTPGSPRESWYPDQPRYGIHTSYHVWTVIDREGSRAVEHFGARSYGGDKPAREAARARRDELNAELLRSDDTPDQEASPA